MKKQIRQRVFETNSSSTHSICIARNPVLSDPPKIINFRFDDFGWEVDKLCDMQTKVNYLYTCMGCAVNDVNTLKKYIQFIYDTLTEYGVEDICFLDNFGLSVVYWRDNLELMIYPGDHYVDHGSEAYEFVDAVCTDKQKLINYLFSEQSFILTGNDNDDLDVDINVDYDHDEYYKGN